MEVNSREFIRARFYDLESRIQFETIKSWIIKRELLSSEKIRAISSGELYLFDEVLKMSSFDFSVFVDILRDSGYDIVADWLMNEETKSKLYYKMNSDPLGYCIIINNVEFKTENLELLDERMISDQDAEKLQKMFTRIGYKVVLHRNLSAEQIKDELVKFSQLDHSLLDSSVVCVLTHGVNFGRKDYLFGSDGNLIDKESIYDIFSYENCKSLLHKPKMFFFHACRLRDYSLHSKTGLLIDIPDNKPAKYFDNEKEFIAEGKSFTRPEIVSPMRSLCYLGDNPKKQPELSDIFVVHSSSPGKVSVEKDQLNCPSVFCQLLVEVFNENYQKSDLDTLMNIVSREINNALRLKKDEVSVHFEKISPYGLVHFYRWRVPKADQDVESLIKNTEELNFENDCLNGNN